MPAFWQKNGEHHGSPFGRETCVRPAYLLFSGFSGEELEAPPELEAPLEGLSDFFAVPPAEALPDVSLDALAVPLALTPSAERVFVSS